MQIYVFIEPLPVSETNCRQSLILIPTYFTLIIYWNLSFCVSVKEELIMAIFRQKRDTIGGLVLQIRFGQEKYNVILAKWRKYLNLN